MRKSTILVALFLISSTALSPVHALPVVGPNIDITISSDSAERQQVEPTIAVDPRNPNIIVAGAQDYRLLSVGGHRWHGYYRSVDGGQTWSVSLLPGFPGDNSPAGLASPLHRFRSTSDPVLVFDRLGNVYYVGITASPIFYLFIAKYVNDGADYAGAVVLERSTYGFADKPWIAVDTSGGPNDGNVYVAYDGFVLSTGIFGVLFTRSTDGGHTFSLPISISTEGVAGMTVTPSGRLYVSSVFISGGNATGQDQVLLTSSDNGGGSFRPTQVLTNMTFLPPTLPGNQFRTGTFPQMASNDAGVYLVYDDFKKNSSSQVMFLRSTNGGVTWDGPNRLNDEKASQHFFSSVSAAQGIISVMWFDSRLGQLPNGTITGLNVFYTESRDNGENFGRNVRVTSVSFNPNIVQRADFGDPEIFMGDYIQLAASSIAVHLIWPDNRDACSHIDPTFGCTNQDVFTATIIP